MSEQTARSSNNKAQGRNDSNRPGRRVRKHPLDPDPTKSFGDPIIQKSTDTFRFFFQNVKGLTPSVGSEDYRYYLNSLSSLQVDIAGLAETNTCWQHSHLCDDFRNAARRFYRQSKVIFGSPDTTVDPVPFRETFQSGGTVTLVSGQLVSRIHGSAIEDMSGLGRWTGVTLSGSASQKLSIITAYRVCSGSIRSAPLGSAFAREFEFFHKLSKEKSVNPRRLFLRDITKVILHLQENGHAVILMLDANATLSSDPHFSSFIDTCCLTDFHSSDPAPSTFIGADSRCIDFVLGCCNARQYLERSGTLAYNEGPQSDHRGLFIDLRLKFFSRQTGTIDPISLRGVHTGNPELVKKYNATVLKYYERHRMVQRIDDLFDKYHSMTRDEIRKHLISWDNDKGRAMKHAEKALIRSPKKCKWSPKLRNLAFLRLYWKLRLREVKESRDYSDTFLRWQRLLQTVDSEFTFPSLDTTLSIEEIRASFNKSSRAFYKCQQDATPLRMKCYEDLIESYEDDSNPATKADSIRKAKIVRRTIDGETSRNKFHDIRRIMKPSSTSTLSKILVPRNADHSNLDPYGILQATDPDDLIWETVVERAEMESILLQYNRASFRAAAESPLGNGLIYDAITFSGLSISADQILSGETPPEWTEDDEAMRELLASFAVPPCVSDTCEIPSEITQDDVLRGFQSWRESTSTSPSGRHLGLYKAEIQDSTLLSCLVKFLNIAVQSGISVPRWSNAVNVLIEKDAGQPKINRLRIIHLFEADFNFFLKLQWGHRLVRRALSLNLLHEGQHGSIPGRTAIDPVMLTQLTSDLCRVLKHDYARFDNDASSCYDRIIVGLGMLAARKCGMPSHAIRTHAEALQFMKYTVKTVHGVSSDNYRGTIFSPLFGTGQGSGASPAVWLSLVVILLQTLDRLIPEGIKFQSLSGDIIHHRIVDAFVDDTSLGFTSSSDDTQLDDLISRLQHVAQTWEHLLYLSGGKLNLAKCSWFILRWEWKQGRPVIRPIQPTDRAINLYHGNHKDSLSMIRRTAISESSRMLGVYLNPMGDFGAHLNMLRKKADMYAVRIMSPRMSADDVRIFHRTTYIPSMRYGLSAVALDEEELGNVQSRIIQALLKKLNVQSTIPTSIRHGPKELGGLELYDLRTEAGIESIQFFRDAIYTNSENGRLLRLNLQYSQLEAGIGESLLEHPGLHIEYLTPTWLLSLRQFLSNHNMKITVSDPYCIPLRGPMDEYIMQSQHLNRYSASQQRDINLVRLFLQVSTLADMADTTRSQAIELCFLDGSRPSGFVLNSFWPRQQRPSKAQIRLWKGYIKSSFLRYVPYWKTTPFISALPDPPQTPPPPSTFSDLFSYLESISQNDRRLLDTLEQPASDLKVWRAFRSRRRLHIATDGGLAQSKGTHGWVIALNDCILFQCAGPVDGPFDTTSSTRCELSGYASVLLFLDHLSKFWGIRHRCHFNWYCDSKAAISRVRRFSLRSSVFRRMPPDADLLSIIRQSTLALRRSIRRIWVKGHQDNRSQHLLSIPAQLNIAADALATEYRLHGSLNSSAKIAHRNQQQCSISINGSRLTSQYNECIRYHVNGYHLRRYIQEKYDWPDSVWDDVDFVLFGSHFRRLNPRLQITRSKIVHDQLPLGERRFKQSTTKDPVLSLCPCCRTSVEDTTHLLRCSLNSHRLSNMTSLRRSICNADCHPVRYLLWSGMSHWLLNADAEPFHPKLDEFPPHFQPHLHAALTAQHAIGWDKAVKGFFSNRWQHLANLDMHHPHQVDTTAGASRMRQIIQATHVFTYETWLTRNSDLHRTDDADLAAIRSAELAEIRYYHGQPHLLQSSDRHYCSRSLDKLLTSSTSTRRRWLRRVKKSILDLQRDGTRQSLITSFFAPQTE